MARGVGNVDVDAARIAARSHKFPIHSPGGSTLFDFAVVYIGSKRTRAKSVIYDCFIFSRIVVSCDTTISMEKDEWGPVWNTFFTTLNGRLQWLPAN